MTCANHIRDVLTTTESSLNYQTGFGYSWIKPKEVKTIDNNTNTTRKQQVKAENERQHTLSSLDANMQAIWQKQINSAIAHAFDAAARQVAMVGDTGTVEKVKEDVKTSTVEALASMPVLDYIYMLSILICNLDTSTTRETH